MKFIWAIRTGKLTQMGNEMFLFVITSLAVYCVRIFSIKILYKKSGMNEEKLMFKQK